MRDPAPECDDEQYPILTNQPDAVVVNPVRRFRAGVILFALAIVAGAGVSAYVSTSVAGEKTDQHVDEVMAELNKRTAERRLNEVRGTAILEQNRRTLCEVLPGVKPTSPVHEHKLEMLVDAYKCGTAKDPIVPPGWQPPPSWPPLPPGPDGFLPTPTAQTTLGG